MSTPTEKDLEDYIEAYLTSQHIVTNDGRVLDETEYHSVSPQDFNFDYCILPDELISFLKATQKEEYDEFVKKAGGEGNARSSLLARLNTELKKGTLSVLRNKSFDGGSGSHFRLIYFKPVNDKTPEHEQWYDLNRLAVVRQLKYSKKNRDKYIIDMAIFVNGLPILTIELKNTLTGQTHHEAIKQYMKDRPIEGEKLLEFKRCLVHFAVGTEQIFMTTCLNNEKTRFVPFNKTYCNEGVNTPGYRTSYFWEDVLRKDSLMDLLQNYINVQIDEEKTYDSKTQKLETKKTEKLIFPRYHQRRAVSNLIKDLHENEVGHRYLIEHSAGSGKSNTITWLAFRLSNLYQHYNDEKAMFDSVFVVTDRRVLNSQLQNNLKQFEMTPGEVAYIDNKCTSQDLKKAIEDRKRIIVTTLQKFPVISDVVKQFPDGKYAIIVDEAHSSQTGEAARDMRKALSLTEAENFDEEIEKASNDEDYINKIIENEIAQKGIKKNISFFAFTATPKSKTIELFCERIDGKKEPFDYYSMEQAIKEGFILDVLENYMSFERYYKLIKRTDIPDKEYEKKKTIRLLTNYVDLQDAAIERKSRIMIEHFMSQTAAEIQGKARAMLVTRSRLHAVRFKRKFDEIMQEMRLPYGALVAFSGSVHDGDTDEDYTENSMNHLEGNISIPEAFKMPKYRILIVAEKYQTGFDEPMLQTMFVDKKLAGVNAVQTLSRLNRTMPGKESTMILDFANKDPEVVRSAFQVYYGKNYILEENETDPNSLYDLKSKIREFNAFSDDDVNRFAKIFFDKKADNKSLYSILNSVCDYIIKNLDENQKDIFPKSCRAFTNLYKFLSQIITFKDIELEKLYVFLVALIKALPYKKEDLPYDVLNESELDSYKIQYQYTTSLKLESEDTEMNGLKPGDALPKPEDDMEFLSKIIKKLNDTFGLELTDDDKVEIKKMKDRIYNNAGLMSYFNVDNTRDNIKDKFEEEIDNELLNFINTKLELYNKLTEDRANTMFKQLWFNELYNKKVRGVSI